MKTYEKGIARFGSKERERVRERGFSVITNTHTTYVKSVHFVQRAKQIETKGKKTEEIINDMSEGFG